MLVEVGVMVSRPGVVALGCHLRPEDEPLRSGGGARTLSLSVGLLGEASASRSQVPCLGSGRYGS